jgi:PPOX class probable F420-dependent enzyme
MALDPADLPAAVRDFLQERQLATLTTLRADGSPHVVPVGFTWDAIAGVVRVITSGGSVKAGNAGRGGRAVVCQVDGRRWLSLEGSTEVRTARDAVIDAEERYAGRYRRPRENPLRVVIVITVDRVLGSVPDSPGPELPVPQLSVPEPAVPEPAVPAPAVSKAAGPER